eukprot:snap_masked-scaffold_24-processed-gene-2.53-mRNA-1 protein AED:1.00 eAED:1.00 QI:0/0/0/0/1/1/2/0/83
MKDKNTQTEVSCSNPQKPHCWKLNEHVGDLYSNTSKEWVQVSNLTHNDNCVEYAFRNSRKLMEWIEPGGQSDFMKVSYTATYY